MNGATNIINDVKFPSKYITWLFSTPITVVFEVELLEKSQPENTPSGCSDRDVFNKIFKKNIILLLTYSSLLLVALEAL